MDEELSHHSEMDPFFIPGTSGPFPWISPAFTVFVGVSSHGPKACKLGSLISLN